MLNRGTFYAAEGAVVNMSQISLADEYPEHDAESSAAAALAKRTGTLMVRPPGRHHPADDVPGEPFPPGGCACPRAWSH